MRLVMMGTGSFAEPTLQALLGSPHQVVGLVTQPDRTTGKERASTRQARRGMKEMAQERGIPLFQPASINTPEGVRALDTWKPDLLVVAAYGQILSKDVLAVAPKGGVNVHASLLPKYRGAAPIAWAIYNGETETGVTIIRMSTALDAGDLLAQEKIPIGPEETAGELETRLAPLGARLALTAIVQIAAGNSSGTPQNKAEATKAPKLTKEHGLIDWTRHARGICDQIRAMQPWPTAFTFLHRPQEPPLRLIVFQARVVPDATLVLQGPRAGLVRLVPGHPHLYVETGAGDQMEILELQPAGKRRMVSGEFLRGHAIEDGWQLGGETP
jgi:methionyl-tRNA formyltransferase